MVSDKHIVRRVATAPLVLIGIGIWSLMWPVGVGMLLLLFSLVVFVIGVIGFIYPSVWNRSQRQRHTWEGWRLVCSCGQWSSLPRRDQKVASLKSCTWRFHCLVSLRG